MQISKDFKAKLKTIPRSDAGCHLELCRRGEIQQRADLKEDIQRNVLKDVAQSDRNTDSNSGILLAFDPSTDPIIEGQRTFPNAKEAEIMDQIISMDMQGVFPDE